MRCRSLILALCASCAGGCFLDRSGLVSQDAEPGVDAGMRDDAGPRDAGPCTPSGVEQCNGRDDDCNGAIDDVPPSPCDSDDPDLCEDDVLGCLGGAFACMDDDSEPSERELCDGADNDCDGSTADDGEDEPELGTRCDGPGDDDLCPEGQLVCTGGSLECEDNTDTSRDDQCDARDQDCNGRVDDAADCPCTHVIRDDDGHSYFFCTSDETWFDARTECNTRGYTLARIDDAAENAWLTPHLRAASTSDFWIAANDQGSEGTFHHDPGTTPLAYDNFKTGEPNNAGVSDGHVDEEDCAELDPDGVGEDTTPGGWNDDACSETENYVCEAEP
jgi:hypothetical protein